MPRGIYPHKKGWKQYPEWIAKRAAAKTIHGMCNSSEYNSWRGMLRRCLNPNSTSYRWYGARGITVCKRWKKFINFLADMEHKPKAGMHIERINNNKGYSLRNCRWVTQTQNNLNRRNPAEAMRKLWESKTK